VLLHLNLESSATFAIALGFTLVGGAVFSITGKRSSRIPQEAVIGIAYVFAAAAADVSDVMVGGRWIVRDGTHATLDVRRELAGTVAALAPA
jgi:hypothetical protein